MTAVLLTALLLQTVLLPTVAGWRPDVVTLTVIAFALADGPDTGARYGFVAGLSVDLLSGGPQLVGLGALVALLVGWGVGRLRPYVGARVAGDVAVAVAAGAMGFAVHGLTALLLDLRQFTGANVVQGATATALWNVLLAPVIIPVVRLLSRRFGTVDGPSGATSSSGRAW